MALVDVRLHWGCRIPLNGHSHQVWRSTEQLYVNLVDRTSRDGCARVV